MIWVLLQSESPWQRNDAITFFIYLCVSLLLVVFFHGMKQQIPQLNLYKQIFLNS